MNGVSLRRPAETPKQKPCAVVAGYRHVFTENLLILSNGGQGNRNLRVKKPCGLLRKFPLCDETGEKPNYHFADNDQNRLINSKEIDRP